jgi:hypothetical protein
MSLLNRIRNRSRIFGEDVRSELKKAGRVIERTFAR